jgi:TRAP-type C4-dicarboxylate transport system substrate-binding protein
MKKRILRCFFAVLLVGIFGINLETTSAAAPSNTIGWKLQSFTAAGSNIWKNYLVPFADLVKERSQGRLDITLYPPGAIVSSPEVTKAVGSGVVEAGLTSPGYDGGIIPESYILAGLPFAFSDALQQLDFWYAYKGGTPFQMVTEAYKLKGIIPISLLSFEDPMVIMTQFPVSQVSDFQGKKIRCTGAHAEAVRALGATPISLPITDVYTSLQTKVIDGHFMALSGLEDFGWKDVVKYVVKPEWMQNSPSLLEVNSDAWNKLPDDLKKIVMDTAREVDIKNLIPACKDKDASVAKTIATAGIKIQTLTGAEAVKFRADTVALWSQAEGRSPANGQLVKMLKDYLTDKGINYPGK